MTNYWERGRDWQAVYDSSLAFESPVLMDALSVWRGYAVGQIPMRRELTARVLKSFLRQLLIFERIAQNPSSYRVRLMGTGACEIYGDLQGKCLHQSIPADASARWTAAIDKTLRKRRPMRFFGRTSFQDHNHLQTEIFLAPLLDDEMRETMALAVVSVTAGVTTSHEIQKTSPVES